MNAIGFLIIGLATAFNFVVIIRKYRLHRYFDAFIDMIIMAIICVLFSGTFSSLVVGMLSSMFVSFYLYFKPLTFAQLIPSDDEDEEYE